MMKNAQAFTLAEVLIALTLLGIIAAFTLPKVLQAQQHQHYNAVTKEVLVALTEAHYKARLEHKLVSGTTTLQELIETYLNVTLDTTSQVDGWNEIWGRRNCADSNTRCYKFPSGAILYIPLSPTGGIPTHFENPSNPNCGMHFAIDPDGRVTSPDSANLGPGKSLSAYIYTNSKISTFGQPLNNTYIYYDDGGTTLYAAFPDPQWFSW